MNFWVLGLTFLSVNLDFFFMLLFLVKKYPLVKVMAGYLLGVVVLLTLSFFVGKTLSRFLPEWLLGLLGFLPIYLALRKDEDSNDDKQRHSAVLSVFFTYLSVCSGCNLSIFLPVLVGQSWREFLITLFFIGLLSLLVVVLIRLAANVPAVSKVMERFGDRLMNLCYVLIGLYVFWDSGLIAHVVSWL